MNQTDTPLYSALLAHQQTNPISFHVPGHKNGTFFPPFAARTFQQLLHIDVTELSHLDDLHAPQGPIREAQLLASALYQSKSSYFLVGGTTAGNLAMILANCPRHSTVLTQRNCHKSIIHGLRLAGVRPVFITPTFDDSRTIPIGLSLQSITEALQMYDNVSAIILTYPNYYGMAQHDLKEIIELAHSHDIPVLVDEAHGCHFILDGFPPSSLQLGADVVVQSAHKTLPAMTMGSFLHINSERIDAKRLEYYLQVVQSSSPSYPIMASLDLARYYLATIEQDSIDTFFQQLEEIYAIIHDMPQVRLVEGTNAYYIDALKITARTQSALSGFALQKVLEEHHIYTELADPHHILFVLPLGALDHVIPCFIKMRELLQDIEVVEHNDTACHETNLNVTTLAVTFEEMEQLDTRKMPLAEAVNQVSAVNVIPYPPGIPILMQGEVITKEHIWQLLELKEKGAVFQAGSEIFQRGIDIFLV